MLKWLTWNKIELGVLIYSKRWWNTSYLLEIWTKMPYAESNKRGSCFGHKNFRKMNQSCILSKTFHPLQHFTKGNFKFFFLSIRFLRNHEVFMKWNKKTHWSILYISDGKSPLIPIYKFINHNCLSAKFIHHIAGYHMGFTKTKSQQPLRYA